MESEVCALASHDCYIGPWVKQEALVLVVRVSDASSQQIEQKIGGASDCFDVV